MHVVSTLVQVLLIPMDVDGYALGCLCERVGSVHLPRPRHILRQLVLHNIKYVSCVRNCRHSVISKVIGWTVHSEQFFSRLLTLELAHQCLNSVLNRASTLSDLVAGVGVILEIGDMMTGDRSVAVLRCHAGRVRSSRRLRYDSLMVVLLRIGPLAEKAL